MKPGLFDENAKNELADVSFLVGDIERFALIENVSALLPFDDRVLEFLNLLSKNIMLDKDSRAYPDVMTLAFWMRKASMIKNRERFRGDKRGINVGRGVVFHIAPSNVPVNYAYSLVAGLITGNANVVRIPSKDFPQVSIINNAINKSLNEQSFLKDYICLIRYSRSQNINDLMSSIADVRIIWGGDNTINEIRKSPLRPRAGEITFADRYSLAIIDSDKYLVLKDKDKFAEDFYNDTYLTDQNACTSPRAVIWTGSVKSEAKEIFWDMLHDLVKSKYQFQSIMGVNKLTSSYLIAATRRDVKIKRSEDNLIIRVQLDSVDDKVMELKDNSGFFFEYDCDDLFELKELCNNTRCQTIGYLGEKQDIMPLLSSGIKGIDRVVAIGKTMDFDLIWDGYNLFERLTRTITVLV